MLVALLDGLSAELMVATMVGYLVEETDVTMAGRSVVLLVDWRVGSMVEMMV